MEGKLVGRIEKRARRRVFAGCLAETESLGLYVFTCLFSSKLHLFFYINQ